MKPGTAIVLMAIAAGALGLGAGFLVSGQGRHLWLRAMETDAGQQVVSRAAPDTGTSGHVQKLGAARPALELPDSSGALRSLDDFSGRPLLVNFMASWCAPCRDELPELDRFAATQPRDGGVQVLGIAVEDAAAAARLLADVPVGFPVLIAGDNGSALMPGFGNGTGVLPYSVLIDAEGKLGARRIGAFKPGSIEAWITAADLAAATGP